MIVSCLYCNKKIKRPAYRVRAAKRGNFCSASHQSSYYWEKKLWDASQVEAAHEAVRDNGQPKHRGRAAAWVTSGRRAEICKRISEAKKHSNWMKGRRGPKSPSWRGGRIWWRGSDWADIRLKALERDGYRCVQCGISQEQHRKLRNQSLQVDHIIPYRITRDNSLENLQTLCSSCHGKKVGIEHALFKALLTVDVSSSGADV